MADEAARIHSAFEAANRRLRERQSGVVLTVRGGRLYLRATFPPPPESSKTQPFQQRLALNLQVSIAGITAAERKARLIGEQLALGLFTWDDHRTVPQKSSPGPQSITVAEAVARMEADYFNRRPRKLGPLATWKASYRAAFIQLDQNAPLTSELLHQAILSKPAGTRAREKFCFALGIYWRWWLHLLSLENHEVHGE